MKILLFGHKGVGKTHLLHRLMIGYQLRKRTQEVQATSNNSKNRTVTEALHFFDLDREIEKTSGRSLKDWIDNKGLEAFRNEELRQLKRIFTDHESCIVAVGGGFRLSEYPREGEIRVWVQSLSDLNPRYLFDRPRLNSNLSWHEEWKEVFRSREEMFSEQADFVFQVPEGIIPPNQLEVDLFLGRFESFGGGTTLFPWHLQEKSRIEFLKQIKFDFFEVRDDLLTPEQRQAVFDQIPSNRLLYSCRSKGQNLEFLQNLDKTRVKLDWAQELGPSPLGTIDILSSHTNLPPESNTAKHLKWSPVVESWSELESGFHWQAKNPNQRSFLPRGPIAEERQWLWSRLWLKGRQQLQFINTSPRNHCDQPTLFEWASAPWMVSRFAAVLGNPVVKSYSPLEHWLDFAQMGVPFYFIKLDWKNKEWNRGFSLLEIMGLRFGAVTSPMKMKIHEVLRLPPQSSSFEKTEDQRNPINTIKRFDSEDLWVTANTDDQGFLELLQSAGLIENFETNKTLPPVETKLQQSVAIWGGGGVLKSLKQVLPQAIHFSTRIDKIPSGLESFSPQVLVWAGLPDAQNPPLSWKPAKVVDLNYRDDSLARVYARSVGAQYYSGLRMFQSQAEGQKKFWGLSHEEDSK